ncbi:hypothetical protein ACFQ0D_32430, partial [Micromonospora zhanjiangensis]
PARVGAAADGTVRAVPAGVRRIATEDGTVSVSVRQDSPLKATLHTTRRVRSTPQDLDRDALCVG